MSTVRDRLGEDWSGPVGTEAEASNAGSRRTLLGAASGFALAASGLLMPEWLVEETEAAKHPAHRVQGRNERRHKHNRNRRNRKRHKDNHDKPAPGKDGQKDVEFVLINHSNEPVIAEVWQPDARGRDYVLKWGSRTVNPNKQEKFTGSEEKLALVGHYVSKPGNLYFYATNPPLFSTPTIEIGQGSWSKNGLKDQGDVYVKQTISEGESVFIDGFRVDRGTDSGQHKIFVVVAVKQ